jgi:cytochrome c-type biogenesis protein CcmE
LTDSGTDAGTASGPEPDLDLTPATPAEPAPTRRWRNWAIMGVFVLAAGAVLYQALTSARVYFLNVDEAVAQRASLGDETFRMQGTVVDEVRTGSDGAMVFTISFGGEDAEVHHVGDEPSDLFEIGQPVVAEGRWDGDQFVSSQVLVKHSEEYVEDNPDRVDYDLDQTNSSK